MFDPTNVCDNRAAAGARPLVNALSAVPRSSPGYPVFPLFSGRFFRRFRECRIGGDKVTARGSVRLNIGKIIAELVDCGITTVVVNAKDRTLCKIIFYVVDSKHSHSTIACCELPFIAVLPFIGIFVPPMSVA